MFSHSRIHLLILKQTSLCCDCVLTLQTLLARWRLVTREMVSIPVDWADLLDCGKERGLRHSLVTPALTLPKINTERNQSQNNLPLSIWPVAVPAGGDSGLSRRTKESTSASSHESGTSCSEICCQHENAEYPQISCASIVLCKNISEKSIRIYKSALLF